MLVKIMFSFTTQNKSDKLMLIEISLLNVGAEFFFNSCIRLVSIIIYILLIKLDIF